MSEEQQDQSAKRYVKVEDLATTVKLKRVQAQADLEAKKAEARADAEARKAEAATRRQEAKLELQRLRLSMSAREAAARHLANFAGLYMLIAVLAFLYAVTTLEADLVAVVAGLITLVVTQVSALLRSIVTEGKDSEAAPARKKTPPE
jgi:Flp pilus assembly protein TadB